jgi:hypothetical protein
VLIVALLGETWGLWRYFRGDRTGAEADVRLENRWSERALLSGGTTLVLLGFLFGSWYAWFDLYAQEQGEVRILGMLVDQAGTNSVPGMTDAVNQYGGLAASRAVSIAAHSHWIEFGLLALLLAFVQPYVFLSEAWKRRWVQTLLAGSLALPLFVLLELHFGLIAGGIADIAGLLVIIGLIGMLVGVLRYSGRADSVAA